MPQSSKMGQSIKDEDSNPWSASSIFDFCYFFCPECDNKSKSKQDFVGHASNYHIGVRVIHQIRGFRLLHEGKGLGRWQ